MKVSTVRLQGLPLGQRQEGREWEDLPESERCGCRKGQRVGRGWRAQAALWCVLLPASQILQDSVNLFFFAESLKERQQVQQLCVIHIVKPGLDWDLRKWGKPPAVSFYLIPVIPKTLPPYSNMRPEHQT